MCRVSPTRGLHEFRARSQVATNHVRGTTNKDAAVQKDILIEKRLEYRLEYRRSVMKAATEN